MANRDHINWLLEGVESWNRRRLQQNFKPDLSGASIYQEFRSARKLDSDGSISLSKIDFTSANLRDASFFDAYQQSIGKLSLAADLSDARLMFADFRGARLRNSRFDHTLLFRTKFDNADLHGASLRSVKAMFASFRGTSLTDADLTDATIRDTSLSDADLSYATLEGTSLISADLTGAVLVGSRPWQARLFRDRHTTANSDTQTSQDRRITCVADLIDACAEIDSRHADNVLYLRGEHTDTWELRPSVMRSMQNAQSGLHDKESDMLLDLMSRRPNDFFHTMSALDQWVMAQHHGLKTRLLDVTRNPLVALFSACESDYNAGRLHVFSVPRAIVKPFNSDTVSIIANFAKLQRAEQQVLSGWINEDGKVRDRESRFESQKIHRRAMGHLYGFIRREKPSFDERIDPRDLFRVVVVEPQQSFERIRAQSGAFLISAFHERFEGCEVLNWNSGTPIYVHSTLAVPKENKQRILSELRLLNVSRETLFPGLDETARSITQRAAGLGGGKARPQLSDEDVAMRT